MTVVPGGFDLKFQLSGLFRYGWIGVVVNCVLKDSNYTSMMIRFKENTPYIATIDICEFDFDRNAGNTYESVSFYVSQNSYGEESLVRVVGHNEFVSVYVCDKWIITFALESVTWEDTKSIYILFQETDGAYYQISLPFVESSELFSWREAVYIEMEQTSSQALDSVIQERPVEITPLRDNGLAFSYNALRDIIEISGDLVYEHTITEQDVSEAASDAILYYSNVKAIRNTDFEENTGFATRVYRLSNLDMDAILAGTTLLQRAYDNQVRHSVRIRPDPRIEIGDALVISYTSSGTGTTVNFGMVVENMSLALRDGQIEMIVDGRNYPRRLCTEGELGLQISGSELSIYPFQYMYIAGA